MHQTAATDTVCQRFPSEPYDREGTHLDPQDVPDMLEDAVGPWVAETRNIRGSHMQLQIIEAVMQWLERNAQP